MIRLSKVASVKVDSSRFNVPPFWLYVLVPSVVSMSSLWYKVRTASLPRLILPFQVSAAGETLSSVTLPLERFNVPLSFITTIASLAIKSFALLIFNEPA